MNRESESKRQDLHMFGCLRNQCLVFNQRDPRSKSDPFPYALKLKISEHFVRHSGAMLGA